MVTDLKKNSHKSCKIDAQKKLVFLANCALLAGLLVLLSALVKRFFVSRMHIHFLLIQFQTKTNSFVAINTTDSLIFSFNVSGRVAFIF